MPIRICATLSRLSVTVVMPWMLIFSSAKRGTDIAHQSAAIEGLHFDVHRKFTAPRLAPVDGEHARRRLDAEARQIGAGLTVDADAAAHRDVADDGLRRHGLAAARIGGQQIADALHFDVGLARPLLGARRDARGGVSRECSKRCMAPATCAALTSPSPKASCSDSALASSSSRSSSGMGGLLTPSRCNSRSSMRAALDLVLRLILLAKPRAHLVAMARAREKARLGAKASRARAASVLAVMISTVSLFFKLIVERAPCGH